jgi:type IV fimbrial biogenesis protein FimT
MMELTITMAIAAILATVAVPSFSNLIASQRAKAAASELFGELMRTRSEAIMRNANITVSQYSGGWNNGWYIENPANPTNVGSALDNHGALGAITVTGPATVTYRPSGRVQGTAAPMFVITTSSGSTTSYQCVSIDLNGRPYMQAASTC